MTPESFSWAPIFNERKVQTLTACCKLYFHGHSVGGSNPSLLNAMAAKAPIAIHNNAFNHFLVKENAAQFSDLKDVCRYRQFGAGFQPVPCRKQLFNNKK